jgi:hypothetical protein
MYSTIDGILSDGFKLIKQINNTCYFCRKNLSPGGLTYIIANVNYKGEVIHIVGLVNGEVITE